MKLATSLAVLAFSLMPALAFANCRDEQTDQTAASCMPGTTWDDARATCIATPSS